MKNQLIDPDWVPEDLISQKVNGDFLDAFIKNHKIPLGQTAIRSRIGHIGFDAPDVNNTKLDDLPATVFDMLRKSVKQFKENHAIGESEDLMVSDVDMSYDEFTCEVYKNRYRNETQDERRARVQTAIREIIKKRNRDRRDYETFIKLKSKFEGREDEQ